MQGKAAIEVSQAAAGAKCRHAQALPLKIASLWIVRESIDAFTGIVRLFGAKSGPQYFRLRANQMLTM
jgi:hypothetical protein